MLPNAPSAAMPAVAVDTNDLRVMVCTGVLLRIGWLGLCSTLGGGDSEIAKKLKLRSFEAIPDRSGSASPGDENEKDQSDDSHNPGDHCIASIPAGEEL
jgi:hypothetical protein